MSGSPNRLNSDFQIIHFIAGACHTPDGAYAVLCSQRENREDAINGCKAVLLRDQAKILRAEKIIQTATDQADILDAQADIVEIEATRATQERNLAGAVNELELINRLIEGLKPHRKYAALPDPEAFELAQREEWRLELIHRAENHFLTSGGIPASELATMRIHPDFAASILPTMQKMSLISRDPKEAGLFLSDQRESKNRFLP